MCLTRVIHTKYLSGYLCGLFRGGGPKVAQRYRSDEVVAIALYERNQKAKLEKRSSEVLRFVVHREEDAYLQHSGVGNSCFNFRLMTRTTVTKHILTVRPKVEPN